MNNLSPRNHPLFTVVTLFSLGVNLSLSASASPAKPNATAPKLPFAFEKNLGQTDKRVQFLSRGKGYTLFLTPKEAVFSLQKRDSDSVLRMKLVHGNPKAIATGLEVQSGVVNYLRGNDSSQWRTGVQTYGKVRYASVYRGIDLVYYGSDRRLEYDFVVSPHADASQIGLKFGGASGVHIERSGNLTLQMGKERVQWGKPVLYQEREGKRVSVAGSYVFRGQGTVGIEVGAYDHSLPLVIDPMLQYSTFFGGSSQDIATGIAVDTKGSAYVMGTTYSSDFPTTAGVYRTQFKAQEDAFVTKFSADGQSIVYSTFFGSGNSYGKSSNAVAIAVDSTGSVYIAGTTNATDFPVTSKAFQKTISGKTDLFAMKLSSEGRTLRYSTYIGGSANDVLTGMAVDSGGNVYLAGSTNSLDFPTTENAFQEGLWDGNDAFVTKLSKDGSNLIYSTYLGGSGTDEANGLTVDSTGIAFVVGNTDSSDFPVTEGAFQAQMNGHPDAFVTKVKADGTDVVYSTFLGGKGGTVAYKIVLDANSNIYLVGATSAHDYPVTQGAWSGSDEASLLFLTKMSSDGSSLTSSFFVGVADERYEESHLSTSIRGIGVDKNFCAYICFEGSSYSPDRSYAWGYIGKFNVEATSQFYTLYVETDLSNPDYDVVGGFFLDNANNVYSAGYFIKQRYTSPAKAFVLKHIFPKSLISVYPSEIVSGQKFTATVKLDRIVAKDTTVSLGCDSNLVLLPSSVVIPKGTNSLSFDVQTLKASSDVLVNLTTTPVGKLLFTPIRLTVPAKLLDLDLGASVVRSGYSGNGKITLDKKEMFDVTINLSSDSPLLTVPATAKVSAYNTVASFPITVGVVLQDTVVNVTAQYNGVSITKSMTLSASLLSDMTLDKYKVRSKGKVTGTVALISASTQDTIITLSSSDTSLANPPATVTVPAGKTSATFTFVVGKVAKDKKITLTATDGKYSVQRTLTIKP